MNKELNPEETTSVEKETNSIRPPSLPQKRSVGAPANWAEKRETKRAEVSTELSFQSESNFYVGFTADISAGGVFVVTWDLVPIGNHISIEFKLPEMKKIIKVDGVVRWTREHNPTEPDLWPGMGIQFEALTDEAQAVIEKFIKAREPLFYDD